MKKTLLISLGAGILTLLAVSPAHAVSVNQPAPPSPVVINQHSSAIFFEEVAPPVGNWTSSTLTTSEGQVGSYVMPTLATCDAATVTSLSVFIEETDTTFVQPVTQDHMGVGVRVVNTANSNVSVVSSVSSGTRMNGPASLGFSPDFANAIATGLVSPFWTTAPTPMADSIQFNVDTTGMTVAQFRTLALTVFHDMNNANGLADTMVSSQPDVNVVTNDAPCVQVLGTTVVQAPVSVAGVSVSGLPETGSSSTTLFVSATTLLLVGSVLVALAKRSRRLSITL